MRCYLRNLIVFVSFCFVGLIAHADLPVAVTKRIAEQKDAFMNVLPGLTRAQHHLLLQRYADLLPQSKDFLKMVIDQRELEEYLNKMFQAPDERPKSNRDYSTDDEEIDALLKKLKSDQKGYFESQDKLQLNFVCSGVEHLFPFNILAKPGELELQLRGIRIPDPDELPGNCLRVKFDSGDSALQITWISSRSYACPIPAARGGECMLNVAEQIAKVLGASTILLEDSAKAQCKLNGAEVSLTLLRSFQKGEGWYESQGFKPRSSVGEAEARKVKLLDYTLESLEKGFKAQEQDPSLQFIDKRILEYRKKEKGKTVAEFMSWLWDTDCSDYAKLDNFFRFDNVHEFSKLYRTPEKLIKKVQN